MKLWKRRAAAVLMSAAMLGAELTAKPLLFAPAAVTATAEEEEVKIGNLTFKKKDTYVVVKRCIQSATDVEIPDTVDGLPVKGIGQQAFLGCSSLTRITIPDSMKSIGDRAFAGCSGLISITIPNSVKSIGDGAFTGCSDLISITIPNSVKSIGVSAFLDCARLKNDTIPDSVTNIGGGAFKNCNGLTGITIPDGVTSIGESTFENCRNMTSITIPDSLTSIGYSAFASCRSLTAITIPDSVTNIGSGAFSGCTRLTDVSIGNGVTSIGSGAFESCIGLTAITIPDSVTSIGSNLFKGCTSLTSITVPDSMTSFSNIILGGYNESLNTQTSITIPDSVTIIGQYEYKNYIGLTRITIPESVTRISYGAFWGCTSLTDIVIPASVYEINSNAFWNCPLITIKCYQGSFAESYARTNNIPYEIIPSSRKLITEVKWRKTNFQYTGSEVRADEYLDVYSGNTKLKYETDYTITRSIYSDLINCTKGDPIRVVVTGIGEYKGSAWTTTYTIGPALSVKNNLLHIEWGFSYKYNQGYCIRYSDGVSDYEYEYWENGGWSPLKKRECDLALPNAGGTWYVSVCELYCDDDYETGSTSWSGVSIIKIASVDLSETVFPYTGKPVEVGKFLTVRDGDRELEYGTDYTLVYENNTDCGWNTASVTVQGIGDYLGQAVTKYYTITSRGDVDCSGRVQIADAVLLARYLAEDPVTITAEGLRNAELDGDETALTAGDLAVLLQSIAGIITL